MLMTSIEETLKKWNDLHAAKSALAFWKFLPKELKEELQIKVEKAESESMDNELDCSKQGLNNWKDFVAKAVERSLSGFKNPYDTSKSSVTHGGGITSDVHVGFNRMLSPGLKIQVMTCVITPCSGTRCQGDNHLCSGDIILD